MATQREVRAALPTHIPYYVFYGDTMMFHSHLSCPGKSYLDPKYVLIRVYTATMASEGGFCGEIIALGEHVDSFSVNDVVFGGGQPCLQQYIVVRADSVALKPKELSFSDAARIYAVTPIYDLARKFDKDLQVLIIGDMTGFAVQFARERGCIITSSEDFDCGEDIIIEEDNYLTWLERHTNQFDIVVDASGDLDLFAYSEIFTTPLSEYCSVSPESRIQATKALLLPAVLGGVPRKLVIARPPKREALARTLLIIAKLLLDNELHILNPRTVAYEHINTIMPSQRYVTSVNVIKQTDLERPESRAPSKKDKGKSKAKVPKARRSSSMTSQEGRTLTSSPFNANPYSPRQPSRLAQSVSTAIEDNEDSRPNLPPLRQDVRGARPVNKRLAHRSDTDVAQIPIAQIPQKPKDTTETLSQQTSDSSTITESEDGIELRQLQSSNYITEPASDASVPRHLRSMQHITESQTEPSKEEQIESLQRQLASLMRRQESSEVESIDTA